jgi:carboxymethylenebutenolidase
MKRDIEIETQDGCCAAGLFTPASGAGAGEALPAVIFYMDAFGPRPALDGMAQRLADAGYIVLLPDLFYRCGSYGPFDGKAFADEKKGAEIRKMMQATTQALTRADSGAFIASLRETTEGPIGAVGYCMGGARAITAAAAYPETIVAAASFHGGNLANEAEDSPHRLAAEIDCRLYVGMARQDKSFPPEQSSRLDAALREADVDFIMENYIGMSHGWTVPDHGVFDVQGAERHWKRLLEFFGETLR